MAKLHCLSAPTGRPAHPISEIPRQQGSSAAPSMSGAAASWLPRRSRRSTSRTARVVWIRGYERQSFRRVAERRDARGRARATTGGVRGWTRCLFRPPNPALKTYPCDLQTSSSGTLPPYPVMNRHQKQKHGEIASSSVYRKEGASYIRDSAATRIERSDRDAHAFTGPDVGRGASTRHSHAERGSELRSASIIPSPTAATECVVRPSWPDRIRAGSPEDRPTLRLVSGSGSRFTWNPDRVGLTGLRPSALPHHRTCGFPHPAVGLMRLLNPPAGSRPLPPPTSPPDDPHPSAPQSRRVAAAVATPSGSDDFAGALPRPFGPVHASFGPSLHPRYRASSLLRPLLTSRTLSGPRSPRVRCQDSRPVPPSST